MFRLLTKTPTTTTPNQHWKENCPISYTVLQESTSEEIQQLALSIHQSIQIHLNRLQPLKGCTIRFTTAQKMLSGEYSGVLVNTVQADVHIPSWKNGFPAEHPLQFNFESGYDQRPGSHPSIAVFVEAVLQQTEQAYATRYQSTPETLSLETQIQQLATQNQQALSNPSSKRNRILSWLKEVLSSIFHNK